MLANKNIPYYLTASGVFILLKFGYRFSDTKELNFLLKPTNKLLEVLTGAQSIYLQDGGYYFEQFNVVIDKSCSGFNFWLLCFLMLSFLTLKYFEATVQKIAAFITSFVGAFILTVFINTSRIISSIIIQNQAFPVINGRQEVIHETIGIVNNLTFLILIYLVVENLLNKSKCNAEFA